jgi:hypothetical protein
MSESFNFTPAQKLAGQDLYGLPCRIPEPVGNQKDCTHTRFEWDHFGEGYWDHDDEWVPLPTRAEVTTMRDIPGTNNMKCDICGYMRRY